MKKFLRLLPLWALALTVGITACNDDDGGDTGIGFQEFTANGSATETTGTLSFLLTDDIEGLNSDDITLAGGGTGIIKGDLTSAGSGRYDMGVTGIVSSGSVTATISKAGYKFSPSSRSVNVYFATGTVVTFDGILADGDEEASTTLLTLQFSADIEGLTAADISVAGGETGAAKGALTHVGGGEYTLGISGQTGTGTITVSISKTGYNIVPSLRQIDIYYFEGEPM